MPLNKEKNIKKGKILKSIIFYLVINIGKIMLINSVEIKIE